MINSAVSNATPQTVWLVVINTRHKVRGQLRKLRTKSFITCTLQATYHCHAVSAMSGYNSAAPSKQWRTQEFCSGGGFNKFS